MDTNDPAAPRLDGTRRQEDATALPPAREPRLDADRPPLTWATMSAAQREWLRRAAIAAKLLADPDDSPIAKLKRAARAAQKGTP